MGKEDMKLNIGLKLLIQNPGSADPVLPIGWCVAPKTLETIERQRIKNPHLLVAIFKLTPNWRYPNGQGPDGEMVYDYEEVERVLIPLKQGLEYLKFDKPGKYRIFSTIVGDDHSDVNDLRRYYVGGYMRHIITKDGDFKPPKPNLRRASIDVEVGAEFFAHEPAEWERNWVNLWFKKPAQDQCQFRRRRILAYSVQAIAMLLFWLAFAFLRFVGASLLLIGGYRNIKWSPIWHPWIRNWEYGVGHKVQASDSVFFKSRKGHIRWFLIPAWPYLSLVVMVIGATLAEHQWLWLLLFFAKAFLWVFGIGLAILIVIRIAFAKVDAIPAEEWDRRRQEREATALAAAFAKQQAELKYLQCSSMPAVPSLKALPHPSIRLRYLALKAKVCRPFSYS